MREDYCTDCNDTSGCSCFDYKLGEAFGIKVMSYNGQVTSDFWQVLLLVHKGLYNTDIADITGMIPSHVELIQYLICNHDSYDYGTSPRGVFPITGAEELLEELLDMRKKQLEYEEDQ